MTQFSKNFSDMGAAAVALAGPRIGREKVRASASQQRTCKCGLAAACDSCLTVVSSEYGRVAALGPDSLARPGSLRRFAEGVFAVEPRGLLGGEFRLERLADHFCAEHVVAAAVGFGMHAEHAFAARLQHGDWLEHDLAGADLVTAALDCSGFQ